MRDFIAGIFMLLEDQYGMGDVVDAGTGSCSVTGTVEGIGLRTTRLRDVNGTLWHLPNGEIRPDSKCTTAPGSAPAPRCACSAGTPPCLAMAGLLIVHHTTSPRLQALLEAVLSGQATRRSRTSRSWPGRRWRPPPSTC